MQLNSDRVIKNQTTNTMKNYLGKKVKGFSFDHNSYSFGYSPEMDRLIGKIGKVIFQGDNHIRIRFKNGELWTYPIELIENHLINQTMRLSDLRELYEFFDDDRSKVERAIKSLQENYVSLDEILAEDYFMYSDYYYSSDEYCIDYKGDLLERDEAHFCEGLEEYVHNDDVCRVYEGRDTNYYSLRYIQSQCFTYFNGDYYDGDALDRNDIVYLEDTEEYAYMCDSYYCDDDGYWYSYDKQEYIRGYHNGSFSTITFNNKSRFKIGYEIEKEDEDVRNSIHIDDFEEKTDGYWRKERDGSLNNESGFELISPTFEMDIDKIFEHIEGNEQLVAHINAEISHNCGGHIHLSESGLDGNELFNKIKGYTPLFYALYYGRVNKSYSKGKSNRDLENENEKYQAIKIHHDRVEFRIISAVPNVSTLKWRTKLLMMILQHPTDDIIKAYYNVDTKFTKLLKQTYSDEKLVELKQRFIKFTKEFENLEIKNNN